MLNAFYLYCNAISKSFFVNQFYFQEYLTPEREFGGGFAEFDDDFEG
jgi:hypothetical protein